MRVISCVPSWTETLIWAGVEVVGRTRFCIHPHEKVNSIPVLGGTKDIDWNKVKALKADILILDKEENPLSFAKDAPLPYWASHVSDLKCLAEDLKKLSPILNSPPLFKLSQNLERSLAKSKSPHDFLMSSAVIKSHGETWNSGKKVIYLIWQDPLMAAGKNTFINSVLEYFGFQNQISVLDGKYPELELSKFSKQSCYLLLSSEPYPFHKKNLEAFKDWSYAIIDGEKLSWFGKRTIDFISTP